MCLHSAWILQEEVSTADEERRECSRTSGTAGKQWGALRYLPRIILRLAAFFSDRNGQNRARKSEWVNWKLPVLFQRINWQLAFQSHSFLICFFSASWCIFWHSLTTSSHFLGSLLYLFDYCDIWLLVSYAGIWGNGPLSSYLNKFDHLFYSWVLKLPNAQGPNIKVS